VSDPDPSADAAEPPGPARAQRLLGRRYRIRGVLGRGGMGVVLAAWDPELKREVALKVALSSRSAARRARFRREGEITASLTHPGIVRVYSAGVVEDTPFLAYELVPGARTLDAVAAEVGLRERVRLLRDAAEAIGAAHARGVVDRDLKPENLLVDGQGRLRVADFGLAAAQGLERLTQTGALLGTPAFMAPELVAGRSERVGPPTDVWSLGACLYEALCGSLPFAGRSFLDLAGRICGEDPLPPSRRADGVPPELEAVCLTALAKDPAARYPDGAALAADLSAWLESRPVSASASRTGRGLSPRTRRGVLLALPALLAVGLLVAAAVQVGPPPGADGAAAGDSPGPAGDGGRPAGGPDPAWVAAGERAFRDLERLDAPAARLEAAGEFRRRWAAHERAPDAAAIEAAARRRVPLFVLDHDRAGGPARGAFLPDGRIATAGADGALALWGPDGEALDGARLVVGTAGGVVEVWSAD